MPCWMGVMGVRMFGRLRVARTAAIAVFLAAFPIYLVYLSSAGRAVRSTAIQIPKQFLWSMGDHLAQPFSEMISHGDPLRASWSILSKLARSGDYATAKAHLDDVIGKYDLKSTGKLRYGYAHEKLPAGWWSGMDMFLLPMILTMVGNKTGNGEYRAVAEKMLSVALKSPLEGGSVWPDEGQGCWISEYSWEGMTRKDEYYVLNGHLFALTALKVTADALKSGVLRNAFACAVAGTKSRADRFIKDTKWPRYMLNAPTINPPHYVVYEAIQLGDLYRLTGDQFFGEQEQARKDVISRFYPVYRVKKSDGYDVFFSASGVPHPDNLFLFEVTCIDAAYRTDSKSGFLRWAFIKGPLQEPACSVVSNHMDQSYELFKATWFRDVTETDSASVVASKVTASLDAESGEGDWFRIDPARRSSPVGETSYLDVEARLEVSLPIRPLSDHAIITMEIETDSALQIGVRLFTNGKVIERYMLPIATGKRIIAFSKLGFDKSDGFDTVERIMLVVHTEKMDHVANVRLGKIAISENQYEFYRALSHTDAMVVHAE